MFCQEHVATPNYLESFGGRMNQSLIHSPAEGFEIIRGRAVFLTKHFTFVNLPADPSSDLRARFSAASSINRSNGRVQNRQLSKKYSREIRGKSALRITRNFCP